MSTHVFKKKWVPRFLFGSPVLENWGNGHDAGFHWGGERGVARRERMVGTVPSPQNGGRLEHFTPARKGATQRKPVPS